ncbi:MAG: hypothetical protein KJ566_00065, partial [Nanoarchaeota archaeon]|nr:hypothetical protein [Nanoarchaeota archaeon]
MIFTGRASEEDKDFDYFGGKIRNAKDKIKEFPIIDNIVNNFIGANKSNCDNNIFLNLASSAFSDPFFQGHPSLSSEFKLKQFEDLLNEILPKLKSDKKEDLKSRLKTLTKKNHLEKIAELNFYRELLENKEISDIYYE